MDSLPIKLELNSPVQIEDLAEVVTKFGVVVERLKSILIHIRMVVVCCFYVFCTFFQWSAF